MFVGTLFPFQDEARQRMLERKTLLVAFHMGLGKCPTTIAACEELLDGNEVERVLAIVPAQLKYQWENEIAKFTDGQATVQVIDGTPTQRARQYRRAQSVDYIIVNYEQVVNDWRDVRRLSADAIVIDEVQAIKGMSSKRSKRIKRLRPEYRYGLSGQPVENRPEEAFSIMEWIDPDLFGSPVTFDKAFIKRDSWGNVKHYRNLPTFRKRLGKAMVRKRRDDPDVIDQLPKILPPQIHEPVFDAAGAKLYRRIAAELHADLIALQGKGFSFDVVAHYQGLDSGGEEQGPIGSKISCLRMLCDHPELLRISARKYDSGDDRGGSKYASDLLHAGLLDGLKEAPKMKLVLSVIKQILESDPKNKVVLFSYFKPTLKLLQEATAKTSRSVIFSGDQSAKEKEKAKIQFQTDPRTRLFLSSDAGGVGVDLPQANYVIHYDLPWSAGQYDQRSSRVIRLSSTFEAVSIVTFLMRGSVEERYYDVLMQKRKIADAFLDGRKVDKEGKVVLDVATLTKFLEESTV